MQEAWSFGESALPLVTTAIHAGHDLRPEVAARIALDDETRLREEDPFTDRLTAAGGRRSSCTARGSRSISTGRGTSAVYDDARRRWGLEVWREPLPTRRSSASLDAVRRVLRQLARRRSTRSPARARSSCSTSTRTTTAATGADAPPAPAERQPGGQRRHGFARSRPVGSRRRPLHRRPRAAARCAGHRARRPRERPLPGRRPQPVGARALRRTGAARSRSSSRRSSWTSGPASSTTHHLDELHRRLRRRGARSCSGELACGAA